MMWKWKMTKTGALPFFFFQEMFNGFLFIHTTTTNLATIKKKAKNAVQRYHFCCSF